MKIRKNIDNETLKIILKAVMKKARIKNIQLTYSDFQRVKDESVRIKSWKSGMLAEEIIDIEYLDNETFI